MSRWHSCLLERPHCGCDTLGRSRGLGVRAGVICRIIQSENSADLVLKWNRQSSSYTTIESGIKILMVHSLRFIWKIIWIIAWNIAWKSLQTEKSFSKNLVKNLNKKSYEKYFCILRALGEKYFLLYRNIRDTKFASLRSMLWSILRLNWSPAPPWCMHHCLHRARLRSATWNHRKWDCPSLTRLLRRISKRYWKRIRWQMIPGSSQVVDWWDCRNTPTSHKWKMARCRFQSVLHLLHRCSAGCRRNWRWNDRLMWSWEAKNLEWTHNGHCICAIIIDQQKSHGRRGCPVGIISTYWLHPPFEWIICSIRSAQVI